MLWTKGARLSGLGAEGGAGDSTGPGSHTSLSVQDPLLTDRVRGQEQVALSLLSPGATLPPKKHLAVSGDTFGHYDRARGGGVTDI